MATRLDRWLGSVGDFGKRVAPTVADWGSGLVLQGSNRILEGLESEYAPDLKDLMAKAEATGRVPPELQGIVNQIKGPTKPIGAFLGQAAAGGATGGLISSTLGPFLLLLQYEIQRSVEQGRWDPQTAAAVYFRVLSTAEALGKTPTEVLNLIISDVQDLGWSSERFYAFLDAAATRLDDIELVRLRIRDDITDDEYKNLMYELGFFPERADLKRKAARYYPSPSDLVRFQAREVYEPAMVARYGLMAEIEALQRDAFYKAGMDDDVIDDYWKAHWEHASFTQATEMLHRGLLTPTGIAPSTPTTRAAWQARDAEGEQALYDWYRVVEIPPFWRELLTGISYSPLTRVDVRRMHKLGVLDRNATYTAYRRHGFDDHDAELMTVWTEKYNAQEDRDLSRTDVLKAYREGKILRAEAESRLADLDYGPNEIDILLAEAGTAALTEYRALTVANLRNVYYLELRSKGHVSGELAKVGYSADDIPLIYELWDASKPVSITLPSRTDLGKFLSAGVIDVWTWVDEMRKHGYSDTYIEWYAALLMAGEEVEE